MKLSFYQVAANHTGAASPHSANQFRLLTPLFTAHFLTNQEQGRLHSGLGARIGGMDKNINATQEEQRQVVKIETGRTSGTECRELLCSG